MTKSPDSPILKVLFASLAVGLLSGCASSFAPNPIQPKETPIGNIQGTVHGGQAPVSGAQIYLFAAGTTGYKSSATSLIKSSTCNPATGNVDPALNNACFVTTDANGNFQLGGEYTCTEGTQVYMVAMGGNPGLAGTVDNTAIVQMAGLGECPAAGNLAAQVPALVINEVTTVAFAYSMGGFATTPFNVSSNAANSTASATAIANAMANTFNIVNIQFGQAPAVANGNPHSINPQAKLYALANIVAQCVNSPGASSGNCTSLFNLAPNSAGTVPTDESTALFNIVHNQGQNVQAIWNLTSTTPVFSPTLGTQPTDWTMPVIYPNLLSVPGTNNQDQFVSGPFNIAFDKSGNAWIGDRAKGVVEIGPQGAAQTFNPNFGLVKGVSISPVDGSIWVSDFGSNVVDVMDSTGTMILRTITSNPNGATLNGPIETAFSGSTAGHSFAFEVNETTAGVNIFDAAAFTFTDFEDIHFANITTPAWIAVDNNGNAWIPSTKTMFVGEVTVKGHGNSGNFTFTSSESNVAPNSFGLVSDANSNIWLASNTGQAELDEIVPGPRGPSVLGSHKGGGMDVPIKLALDGGNNIWIANENANTVSGFNTTAGAFMASNGFSTSAGGAGCEAATPDPSGNLWVANSDGSVTVLLGLATPTAAPLFGGITATGNGGSTGNLGSKP